MNPLATIKLETTNREEDVSVKTPIPMDRYADKTYCHLICNNAEVYDLFKTLGDYIQETDCKTHNETEECDHKHKHILLRLHPQYVVKNARSDRYLTNRMAYLVDTRLAKMVPKEGRKNRRQFLCKRLDCSSHFNGCLHYMGCVLSL